MLSLDYQILRLIGKILLVQLSVEERLPSTQAWYGKSLLPRCVYSSFWRLWEMSLLQIASANNNVNRNLGNELIILRVWLDPASDQLPSFYLRERVIAR